MKKDANIRIDQRCRALGLMRLKSAAMLTHSLMTVVAPSLPGRGDHPVFTHDN